MPGSDKAGEFPAEAYLAAIRSHDLDYLNFELKNAVHHLESQLNFSSPKTSNALHMFGPKEARRVSFLKAANTELADPLKEITLLSTVIIEKGGTPKIAKIPRVVRGWVALQLRKENLRLHGRGMIQPFVPVKTTKSTKTKKRRTL